MSEEMKHPEEKKPKGSYKSTGLGRYLAILFAAAFLMLLLAYFMQLRTSEETLGSLKESLTSIESLDELVQENQTLHDKLEQIEDAYDAMKNTAEEQESQIKALTEESESQLKVIRSWEAVYQLDVLYHNEDYEACAEQARTILNSNDLRIPETARPRFEEIATTLQEMELLQDWEF